MKKSLFFAGLLSLSSLVVAGSKSYPIVIDTAAKAGSVQLAKGDYTVQVEGDKAVFTDQHRKSVSVSVKLDTGTGKKFANTSVEATHKDGTVTIQSIHLGGSTTTLEFGGELTN
jgi:outer membrane protein assembly factor BamB